VASPRPIPGPSPSPAIGLPRCRPRRPCPQSRSGRAFFSASCSRLSSLARPMSAMAVAIRSASSCCCSGLSDCSSRCAAAARRASASVSSSSVCGFSGKCWPCRAMKSANCWSVSSPRASASSIALRSASMSFNAAMSSGDAFCIACFMPRNWLSSTSLRSRSWICSYAAFASSLRHWWSASWRTARAGSLGSMSSSASAIRAASDGSGNSARLSASTACSSSSLTCCRVPSRSPRERISRRRSRTRRSRSSRPARSREPRRSRASSACRGVAPARTSSPTSSSAPARSNGGASGSGPSSHAP
jgi:hypothetical protein